MFENRFWRMAINPVGDELQVTQNVQGLVQPPHTFPGQGWLSVIRIYQDSGDAVKKFLISVDLPSNQTKLVLGPCPFLDGFSGSFPQGFPRLIPLVAQPCCLVRMGHICWWIPPAVGSNSLVRPQEFCVPWPQEQAREQVAKYAQEADCHYCDLRPLVLGDAGMQKLNGDREWWSDLPTWVCLKMRCTPSIWFHSNWEIAHGCSVRNYCLSCMKIHGRREGFVPAADSCSTWGAFVYFAWKRSSPVFQVVGFACLSSICVSPKHPFHFF